MRVGVLGINFKTAELFLREMIARRAQSLSGEKSLFFPHPTILLSTCNRTEIYFSAVDLAAAQSDLLALLRLQVEEPFEHRLYSYFGVDCFAHLCRVAAGLDSAIVAETEIQRQVKMAYARACEVLTLPGCIHYLFQKALQVAKLIRNLDVQRGVPSLFGTLWEIGCKELGGLEDKRVLLVGYSEIHRGFASFLAHKGIRDVTFCTRRPRRVQEMRACGREELEHWSDYDLISCASKSDDFLVRGRGKKNQLIFDLSVPRNVDPAVAGQGVTLYNIDQLIEHKECTQGDSLQRLDEILWEKVALFTRLYREKVERGAAFAISR